MVRVHHEDPEHRAHLPAWRIHALTRDFRLEDVSAPRSSCQARSSTAIQPGGSACSPPAPPPASPRSRWGWGLPTRNRNPLDPCSSTPVPPCSSSPRRWRGGELSDCGGPGVARSKPWEVSDELWAVVEPLLPKVERLSSAPSPLAAPG